ncbi:MAG: YqaA family protein [Bryobacteraceae bacterium]
MHGIWSLLASFGSLGVFLMAVIDSIGVPNPGGTDLLLLVVTIANPANAWLNAGLAVIGSLSGAVLFYEVLRKGGERFLERHTRTGRGAKFRAWFAHYGMLTVLIPALLPIPFLPFKFFAGCAAAMRVSRTRFFLVLAAGRIPRYFGLAFLGAQLGQTSLIWATSHVWVLAAFAAGLFVALYIVMRRFDRNRVE